MERKNQFTDEELAQVDRLLNSIGVTFTSLKQSHVLRRLRIRMSRTNCKTIYDYSNYVKHNEDEKKELYLAFSINVTRFFRDPDIPYADVYPVPRPFPAKPFLCAGPQEIWPVFWQRLPGHPDAGGQGRRCVQQGDARQDLSYPLRCGSHTGGFSL